MSPDEPLPKEPESEVIARFQDCDPFGHLNNARYMDYFINAREDHLIHFYNLNIYEHADKTKAAWVISKTQIAYLRPVLVMEKVRIRTRVLHYSENNIVVEGLMLDSEGHATEVHAVDGVCLRQPRFRQTNETSARDDGSVAECPFQRFV